MAPGPSPWLSIVGIGEDGAAGLSPCAAAEISRAALVVGGARHLALAASVISGETLGWRSPIEDTFPALLARRGRPTCVLATGDPFHFGIGATLARLIPAGEIGCWPHASAFGLAAARLGWAVQDCLCLSLHGRTLEQVIPHLQPRRRVLALSWDRTTPTKLAALLRARGFGRSRLTVCEVMGGDGEAIRRTTAAGFDLAEGADLNTIALELEAEPGARIRPFAPGLPDDWFEHDGQITKAAIRAVTLAGLAPRAGDLLWDIGTGSGSVSIEWLLADPTTQATALDRRPDRLAGASRNAANWGVADRFSAIEAAAPDRLSELPRPDAVFIGGGLTAPGLLGAGQAALAPGGRLVANAVTLESQRVLSEAYGRHGGALTVLSVAIAEPVGNFHGLRPAMPVMQWRWTKS